MEKNRVWVTRCDRRGNFSGKTPVSVGSDRQKNKNFPQPPKPIGYHTDISQWAIGKY